MTVFWRLDYDGDFDKQFMLDRGELAWPRGVSAEDRQRLGKRMRVGHGVVMGRLAGKVGRIEAIGHITNIAPHPQKKWQITIDWQAIPMKVVHPESSGVSKWKKHPVFKFDPAPAQRYKLVELLQTHFGIGMEIPSSNQDGIDTQPIIDLVRAVLASMTNPPDADIIDQVFIAIEQTPQWKKRYDIIVDRSGVDTDDPKGFVHSRIGMAVRAELDWVVIERGYPATNGLTKSYSRLAPSS